MPSSSRSFRALVAKTKGEPLKITKVKGQVPLVTPGDPAANVTVRVKYSTINYKDAMVLLRQPGVAKFPLVPGIDAAGEIVSIDESTTKENNDLGFSVGDEVIITGNKIGQLLDGGYSDRLKVQAGWLVKRPSNITLWDSMALGSAGITAMMCIKHLQDAGNLVRYRGTASPVLVTGAGGGLGGIAITLLHNMGYRVVASTRRANELGDYLRHLGADDVIGALDSGSPLGKQVYCGVIDAVGGHTLASALSQTKYRCAVASTGVAGGGELKSTVYPFILRGVRLLGVDSTLPWNCPGYDVEPSAWKMYRQERIELWELLSQHLGPFPASSLRPVVEKTIGLEDVTEDLAQRVISGKVRGRYVIDLGLKASKL
ncbi:putative acrylyl-CoA reductase AcuI [Diplonema papillatum]|nr:putative acrylyl-CoA reductase AcuI [Diplonema papillatum]